MLKKGISITSFNRPDLLNKCLEKIKRAKLSEEYSIIIIQQNYNERFEKLINKFEFSNLKIIKTSYPHRWNSYKKMTLNGYKGFEYCFDKIHCDIGFYLEDDIMVSSDFFLFCEKMLEKYKNDKNFFAVNGFSKEPFNIKKIQLYSKFVFGIGKGWAINKDRWKIIKKIWSPKFINSTNPEYDYPIENYIKKNYFYVVMPACSRTYELPSNGVSVKKNDKEYFKSFKNSFVKIDNKNLNFRYSYFVNYNWRKDCKKYKGKLIGFFILNFKLIKKKLFNKI